MKIILAWLAIILYAQAKNIVSESNPYTDALRALPWAQQQRHGYLEVRPGAFMFYWLYYADGTKHGANKKPLIIWIQGGPALAASGVGNFGEFGPLDLNLKPRNHTWVKGRSVLLLDHPVGTGFSYVTDNSLYAKTDQQMAIDLSVAIKKFYKLHKYLRSSPAYLIGQSYGGKLCPRLGMYLYTAIKGNQLKMNFKGIGIGSGWVNPFESTLTQAHFLYYMGAIDYDTYKSTSKIVKKMARAIATRQYNTALVLEQKFYSTLIQIGINFENLEKKSPDAALYDFQNTMNKYVKPTLNVNQTIDWVYLEYEVYEQLKTNFFVPSHKFLEGLLNISPLKIAIYNGNLDVTTPLAGASNWVHKLHWQGSDKFRTATRQPINGNNGFYKAWEQLSFWTVLKAGHWVPDDNPVAMEHILKFLMTDA